MKNKIIIIEGSQGVGKGTITNLLRENIPYTTLMRLSGIKDKSYPDKVFVLRKTELDLLFNSRNSDTTYILDRSFLTEKIYCNLGYKDYDFISETDVLINYLNDLTFYYDVYIIGLYLNDVNKFSKRLMRNKGIYEHSKFSVDNSIKQQKEYIKEINKIKRNYPRINCSLIPADDSINNVYNNVLKFCGIAGEI